MILLRPKKIHSVNFKSSEWNLKALAHFLICCSKFPSSPPNIHPWSAPKQFIKLIEIGLQGQAPHPLCFDLYWAKSAVWTHSYYLVEPILPLTDQITPLWSLLKVSGSVVGFKQPTRAWKHTGGANFSGCHRVIVTDLVAQERKFVANSRLKKAEKFNFSWN